MSPVLPSIHLLTQAPSLGFTDVFAFGAPKVIGHFVAFWVISYTDKLIVTGMKSASCIPTPLYTSDLGRHTSILFLHREGMTLQVTRYAWGHTRQRPNMHTFPPACPECNCIQSWACAKASKGKSFTLQCTTKVGGGTFPDSYVVDSCPPSTVVQSPYVSSWVFFKS